MDYQNIQMLRIGEVLPRNVMGRGVDQPTGRIRFGACRSSCSRSRVNPRPRISKPHSRLLSSSTGSILLTRPNSRASCTEGRLIKRTFMATSFGLDSSQLYTLPAISKVGAEFAFNPRSSAFGRVPGRGDLMSCNLDLFVKYWRLTPG